MKISKNNYTKLLSKYLKHSKLQILLLSIVMIVSITIQLINPQIVSYFIDGITAKKPINALIIAAIIFISAAFMQQLLAVISTYLSQNIGWSATNRLRLDLVKHCLGLDMAFFKEHQAGEIVERIDGDVTALFKFFSELLIKFGNNALLVIGIIVLLMIKNVMIGAAVTIFLVLSLFAIWKVQQGAVKNFKENREITAKFYGFLGEHIASTEDIKSSGAVKYVMNRFFSVLQKWLPISLKANLSGYKIWMTLEGVFGIGNAMIFALGGYLWYKGNVTIGTVYLMINYIQLLEKPLTQLREQLQEMQKASASIVRINELFNIKSQLEHGEKISVNENKLFLNIDNVCFEYEEDSPVLKNISFKLPYGRILGVLGCTGSGKTTLARLIVRFYDAKTGKISINNTLLKDIEPEDLRKNIAYVTQDVQLFNASVRDNITFFNKKINDDKIIGTIYDMGLGNWYEKLGDGLNTVISPGGGMSSGEAQLLALIRVFLRNPKLIILDEASSRLDPATEKLVDAALEKLIEGRSCIIIAHRLGTVEKADDILILDKGSVLEYGTRKDLIRNKNSRLNELLNYGIEEALA
ncbi:ABC transporter ATP-binding protein [Clostridium oryzae]|uniref:Putative ABC transporter ATP-binding protein n=1 Tax=Clostridium oryzae TaxID=1450648 RepID=A0A1V4I6Q4_9CLOT|nr:ABC transporter ATP-binding protein [Clostridium oryzae]OPJ55672.1 putative ABC transporter ATP-binding protein [Clostridium oryzae]